MRVNVYNEEITDEVSLVRTTADNTGVSYCGLRFILKSHKALHHTPEDDGRSAVTFWLGTEEKCMQFLQRAAEAVTRSLLV